MLDIILDALIDALKLLPVLVPMYLIIEIIERRGLKYFIRPLSSRWSVFAAAGVGIIPQCGFSVVAAKLYSKKLIPLGALIAVLITASDEAVPILLREPLKLLPLLGIKLVMAISAGFCVNAVIGRKSRGRKEIVANATIASGGGAESFCSFGCHNHEIGECSDKSHERDFFHNYILHPLIHVATVFLFIVLVNIVFGVVIELAGAENLNNFMKSNRVLQPLLAALIGLIPNCASSVAISQMFALGQLNLGAAVAGLSVNAGVSYIVLFKENKNRAKCFYIIGGIFVYSVVVGTLVCLIGGII